MNIKYLNSVLSIILLSFPSTNPPIGDSYTICMPTHLNLNDTESFTVELEDQNLLDTDSINISFSNSFTLSDAHGKDDITGTVLNPNISFTNDDASTKTINYEIDNPGVGEWTGNLDVLISLDRQVESNVLIDGPSLNAILKQLNPTSISFSHSAISGNYLYDVSLAKDESILLYMSNNQVTITNNSDEKIKANENMSEAFRDLDITKISNLSYLDMLPCTNISKMFQMCELLTTVDVSKFDTSNITDMSYAFDSMHKCTTIRGIDNWDVSNVTTISHLLNDDRALTSIPAIYNWNITNKCTDISYAMSNIAYKSGIMDSSKWKVDTTYDFTKWDVSNVEDMSYLFAGAFNLKTIDLTGWNTGKVTNISHMFEMYDSVNKSALQTVIGIENFDVRNVTNMESIFYECRSLIADFSLWQPNSVNNLINAFYDTRSLNLHTFDNWDKSFNINNVDYTDCFGDYAGYNVNQTYRPNWYK